jgi:hypothetical protein
MNAPRGLASALAIVLAAAGMSGCATTRAPSDRGLRAQATAIRIRNDNWQDVRVYLLRANGGPPVRLATVGSMSSAVIRFRGAIAAEAWSRGSIQLLLRPIGTRSSFTTPAVFVGPGDVMRLTVANQLTLSTVFIDNR